MTRSGSSFADPFAFSKTGTNSIGGFPSYSLLACKWRRLFKFRPRLPEIPLSPVPINAVLFPSFSHTLFRSEWQL